MKYLNTKPKQGEESKPDHYPSDNIQLAGPKQKDQDEYDEPEQTNRPQPNGDRPAPRKQ